MRRTLTTWVLFPLFLLTVIIGVSKALHWRYLRRITPAAVPADPPNPVGIDALAAARIGVLHPPRQGSFQLAARGKPADTVRIGAFGDSFTYGLEVEEGFEWPRQLEALLNRSNGSRVEVLNFGNPGFGAHQTHMMAEFVAPAFGVDYTVFAPLPTYWAGRDRSFAFWPPDTIGAARLGFHARYVLDGDGIALIDVVGNTERERRDAYTRFVPPFRYLRFDERLPAFLQAWLPAGRTLLNPFYYSRLPRDEEVGELYRRLLRQTLRAGTPTVVIDTMGKLTPIVDADPQLAAQVIRGVVPSRFPYLAPQLHWSPWGHHLVAENVARAFGARMDRSIDVIETARDPDPKLASAAGGPLDTYDRVHVDMGNTGIGRLYLHRRGAFESTRLDRLPPNCHFLVALAAPEQPLVDAVFVPLTKIPTEDSVILDAEGTRSRTVPLIFVAPDIARVDLCSREMLGEWAGPETASDCPLALDWDADVPRQPIVVRLGDQAIADIGRNPGSPNPGTLWTRGPYLRAHADGGVSGDPAAVAADGTIRLVLERHGAPSRHVTLASYRRVAQPPTTPPLIPGFEAGAAEP